MSRGVARTRRFRAERERRLRREEMLCIKDLCRDRQPAWRRGKFSVNVQPFSLPSFATQSWWSHKSHASSVTYCMIVPLPNAIRRMDKLFELTSSQLAVAQARRERKRQAEILQASIKPVTTALLQRQWLNVTEPPKSLTSSTKILTWNVCGILSSP